MCLISNLKIYKANDRKEGRNRQLNNDNWRFHYPTFRNGETTSQKINKNIEDWNTTNPLELTEMCRTHLLTTAECTFFSSTNWTFYRINYMLGHKTSLNKI